MRNKKRLIISIGVVILILPVLLFYKEIAIVIYRGNPESTVTAFAKSLRENDSEMALGLTSERQHQFIEDWMQNHQPIDGEKGSKSGPTALGRLLPSGEWLESITFNCMQNTSRVYCFKIESLLVSQTEKGWLITDWSLIKEGKNQQQCSQ